MNNILPFRKNLKMYSKSVCAIVVAFMVGYWFYKYTIDDRDIGVVDFVPVEEASNINLPVASLCFKDPVVETQLMKVNSNITQKYYLNYLHGKVYSNNLEKIDYQSVSIDLHDYFLYADELWRDQTSFRNSTLAIEHKEIFSGFYYKNIFLKYFSIRFSSLVSRNIKRIKFHYNLTRFRSDWWPTVSHNPVKAYIKIHYPGQFL